MQNVLLMFGNLKHCMMLYFHVTNRYVLCSKMVSNCICDTSITGIRLLTALLQIFDNYEYIDFEENTDWPNLNRVDWL